ncbi:hypothetical protein [Streptomyces sp. NPDC058045]|uniref:hypothetical protein n=1 Tax=Streptomyces sp. NPDC058045 TaxID=3346311 RepID=UPI0036E2993E
MSNPETSRYVRLQVDLVVEITDPDAVTGAALQRIADRAADENETEDERTLSEDAVQQDEAAALAYLVDPFDLVGDVPGTDLVQASWSSEDIDYDPDAPPWAPDGDEDGQDTVRGGGTPGRD